MKLAQVALDIGGEVDAEGHGRIEALGVAAGEHEAAGPGVVVDHTLQPRQQCGHALNLVEDDAAARPLLVQPRA